MNGLYNACHYFDWLIYNMVDDQVGPTCTFIGNKGLKFESGLAMDLLTEG